MKESRNMLTAWLIMLASLISLLGSVAACHSTFKYTTDSTLYHHYEAFDPDGIFDIKVCKIIYENGVRRYEYIDPSSQIYVVEIDPTNSCKAVVKISKALIRENELGVFIDRTTGGYDLWEIPQGDPTGYYQTAVGGVVVPTDKFGLLAPYFGAASTIIAAAVVTAMYIRRTRCRKEKTVNNVRCYLNLQSRQFLFKITG